MVEKEFVPIDKVEISAYEIPTDSPESDGTLKWDSTTIILVEITADNKTGIGYTYSDLSTAALIKSKFKTLIEKSNALSVSENWQKMYKEIRNIGRPGIASTAIAAMDTALWDLKAKIFNVPLVTLFGQIRESLPIYGSGGFTSYSIERLQEQLSRWVDEGIPRVKMKIGRNPEEDFNRVESAKSAIGSNAELFVDANGAYSRKQALNFANQFAALNVKWFEEPVSSDDLDGLRLLRNNAPATMNITAGEYGYDIFYFRRMLEADSVDVLQADASRCGGFTGFLKASVLCESQCIQLSSHTAPFLHLHVGCAAPPLIHAEYFYDHIRIEKILFENIPSPVNGQLKPDLSEPGIGIEIKRKDVEKYLIT